MQRLRRAFRRHFGSRDVPEFDDEELMLEEDELDDLVQQQMDDSMKTDDDMDIPSFDYHPREGLQLN